MIPRDANNLRRTTLVDVLALTCCLVVARTVLGTTLGYALFVPVCVALAGCVWAGRGWTLVAGAVVGCGLFLNAATPSQLAQWIVLCVSVAMLTRAIGRFSEIASLLATMAWMTFPVWVSPLLQRGVSQSVVSMLLDVHPLIATNGIFLNLGDWTHAPIAYARLTTLGQDTPYAPPTTAWPAIVVHLLLAILLTLVFRYVFRHNAKTP